MSVVRVGWSKKYGDNFDSVFGGKKKKTENHGGNKSKTIEKKSVKKKATKKK
jgi:hypothetical protein